MVEAEKSTAATILAAVRGIERMSGMILTLQQEAACITRSSVAGR